MQTYHSTRQYLKNNISFMIGETLKISKSRLVGSVQVSGAKNSALRLLAGSILTDESVELSNFPNGLLDIGVHLDMLKVLGKSIYASGDFVSIKEVDENTSTDLSWEGRS